MWRNALVLVEETEGYSRKRLSLILIEVSKPFVIQALLRRLDSRRVIRTRGTCSLNKDVAESMKELKEVLTSPSSNFPNSGFQIGFWIVRDWISTSHDRISPRNKDVVNNSARGICDSGWKSNWWQHLVSTKNIKKISMRSFGITG